MPQDQVTGITYVRDRQMAAQLQTALQETEYKLQ